MNQLLSKLQELKQQRELSQKPFPVWALLILYVNSHPRDTYRNYFEGFKLLKDWLSPIELTPHSEPIPELYRTYEIQELSKILGTTQENLNHAYITAQGIQELIKNGYKYRHSPAISQLQQPSHIPQLPSQVSTPETQLSCGI